MPTRGGIKRDGSAYAHSHLLSEIICTDFHIHVPIAGLPEMSKIKDLDVFLD